MFSSRRTLVLLVGLSGLSVLRTPSACAGLPPENNSVIPQCFSLVGSSGGVAAQGAGGFTVIVRDLANNPIPHAHVVVDLSGHSDLILCANQLDPLVDVDCANKRVGKYTDQSGRATFVLLGGSTGAGHGVTLTGGSRIYEDGVLLGSPNVSTFDLDGTSGVGANDLSTWLSDFGSGISYGRSDYDCSESSGANDLSLWLTAYGSGAQAESCGARCP